MMPERNDARAIEDILAELAAEVPAEDWAALPERLPHDVGEALKMIKQLEAEAALWDETCATCAYGMTHGGCPAIAAIREAREGAAFLAAQGGKQ